MSFSQQLFATFHSKPEADYMEFKGRLFSRGEMANLADHAMALLDAAGVDKGLSIGVVVRNRPLHAAAMMGLISTDRWLTSVYALQTPAQIAQELRDSRFAAVFADAMDWTPDLLAAARACGTMAIRLDLAAEPSIAPIPGLDRPGPGPFRKVEGEPGLEILSSGTTGKPKRVVFPSRILVRMVESTTAGRSGPIDPDICVWPYGGIGGMIGLVASTVLGRHTIMLEKFNVPEWVAAVEKVQPRIVSGVPAIARMLLDAKVPREKLASVKYFMGGSAPMTPELQDEFESTFGIDVIWAYGATEFCGTIISWSPELHAKFRDSKRGSMGVALPGIGLRTVDVESGQVLQGGGEGYLQALVPAVSGDWISTTDIVTIDADGFVFHKGRGDGAINRGGHKVLPEKLVEALRSHPAVLDAGVVGIADARLGSVPVAAVELRSGVTVPGDGELFDHLRKSLTAPYMPVEIRIVGALPRTTSLKVDMRAVRQLFAA